MVFSGPREISINNVQEIHSSDLGQRPGFPCGIRYQERGHIGEIPFKLVIEAYMENTDIKHWTRNRNACNRHLQDLKPLLKGDSSNLHCNPAWLLFTRIRGFEPLIN
jgi:hypothetical protein